MGGHLSATVLHVFNYKHPFVVGKGFSIWYFWHEMSLEFQQIVIAIADPEGSGEHAHIQLC